MKKTIVLVLIAIMLCSTSAAYGVTDENFVQAKANLLVGYERIETESVDLQNLFAKEAKNMPASEQAMLLVANAEFEIARLMIKEVLALFTLQAVQESTPPEAKKMLVNECLDSTELSKAMVERLSARMHGVSNQEAKEIIKNVITICVHAVASIKTLQGYIQQ